MNETNAPLRVFLCYSSIANSQVRKFYHYLESWGIQPWMAPEDLRLGTNWEVEIQREIASSDLIIICLTKDSINRQGYFQKEIGFALERSKEMPDGQIFIIPVKLEECDIPRDLKPYHYWNLSAENDYSKLVDALEFRASQLGRTPPAPMPKEDKPSEKRGISRKRVLEAAIQSQVFVGKPASLFVWIRRHGSKNIISIVKSANEDIYLDERNVKTNELEVEFPIKNGQTLPAEITIRLDAPEFEPSPQEKNIYIPLKGDSTVCRFVVTPKRTGELLLNLEILRGKFSVGSTDMRTTAFNQETKVDSKTVLMVVPIFVLVQAPPVIPDSRPVSQKEEKPAEIQADGNTHDHPVMDESGQKGKGGKIKDSLPTNSFSWAVLLGFVGVVLAYLIYRGIVVQTQIPLNATQTAEVKLTSTISSETPVPTLTNTSTPTVTPTSTLTPTLTPPSPGDFEINTEGWGDKPFGRTIITDAVKQQCESVSEFSFSGLCWLQYTPTKLIGRNAYLVRKGNESDTETNIKIRVKVPKGVSLCTNVACSTAKIIIWDQDYVSHERPKKEYVELDSPGSWMEVSFDLRGKNFPSPYQFVGIHFYIITDYKGPIFIDTLTTTEP